MAKVNLTPDKKIKVAAQAALYTLGNIRDTIELIRVAADAPTDISPCMSGTTILIDHAADEIQGLLNDILEELKTLETQKVVA